jgi:hypothetical protein
VDERASHRRRREQLAQTLGGENRGNNSSENMSDAGTDSTVAGSREGE